MISSKLITMEEGLGRKKQAQSLRQKKYAEILIAADGDTKSKFLPSDVYYDHVKITVSRRHRRVEIGG